MSDKDPNKYDHGEDDDDDVNNRGQRDRREFQRQQSRPLDRPESQQPARGSNQWIPPTTGNPDLDPAGQTNQRVDLRERNPLTPQGMLYDPRQLLDRQQGGRSEDYQRPGIYPPPGARFDPFGPPDPSQVGPGRGPQPGSQFGIPDPDHFQPPGQPQPPNLGGKNVNFPWGPPGKGPGAGGRGFPPAGGSGGSPFL